MVQAGWESLLDPCHLSLSWDRAVWKRGKLVVLIRQEKENKEGSKCALAATSYLAPVNWVSHLRATMSLAAASSEEYFMHLNEYGFNEEVKKYPGQGDLPVFR